MSPANANKDGEKGQKNRDAGVSRIQEERCVYLTRQVSPNQHVNQILTLWLRVWTSRCSFLKKVDKF